MILEQVRADIAILEGGILFLRSSAADVTSADGELLQGKAREAHLEYAVSQNKRELCRLNAILASKVVPKTYISAVTKQTYHRSAEEEPQKNLPPALFYTFCAKGSRKTTGRERSLFFLELTTAVQRHSLRSNIELIKNIQQVDLPNELRRDLLIQILSLPMQ